MALIFGDLKNEVRSFLGERSDLDSRLGTFLNLAQVRIARAFTFPEFHRLTTLNGLFNGDGGDRLVTLPSKIRSIRSFSIDDAAISRKLEYKSPREFDRLFDGYESRGRSKPVIYTRWAETAELYPLPDQLYTYTLRWVIWPTEMTVDATPSELVEKDELLIYLATSIAYHSTGKTDKGKDFYGMFKAILDDVVNDETVEPDQAIQALVNTPASAQQYWANPFISGVR